MGEVINLVPSEGRLANVIWREAPLASSELVALALEELGLEKINDLYYTSETLRKRHIQKRA